jgi:hypothetical protein
VFKRFTSFLRCGFFLLTVTACTLTRPNDLRIEAEYVADRTSIPIYARNVREGFTGPYGLAIQLSTTEQYRYGAYVREGFCGDALEVALLGDGFLYKVSDRNNLGTGRHQYIAFSDLQARYMRSLPRQPHFDLTRDTRDICVQTVFQGQIGSVLSNIVRVPRASIERALRDGVKRLPNVEMF